MLRLADNIRYHKGSICALILGLFFFLACTNGGSSPEADRLNDLAYAYRYRSLDTTRLYADSALLCARTSAARAAAYNNLAFVHIADMAYMAAADLLDSVYLVTGNELELLVADIQNMRLCQRKSSNKSFYDYRQQAMRRLESLRSKVGQGGNGEWTREQQRLTYAETEFAIVSSTYYYYVGLAQQCADAITDIDVYGGIARDTAQYLNYLYQIGSGGIISGKDEKTTCLEEFDHLLRCLILAEKAHMPYWQANALQAIAEMIGRHERRQWVAEKYPLALVYLNSDSMPDSLLAGNLALRSQRLFEAYGDVYQTACAYRTLAWCFWQISDYESALVCLYRAMSNISPDQAPALMASIHEAFSLVHSAMDNKPLSDGNRNLYLDLQEETRQDRQLEARVEQLQHLSSALNTLIAVIVVIILFVVAAIVLFWWLRRGGREKRIVKWLWRKSLKRQELQQQLEAIADSQALAAVRVSAGRRRWADNKAKIFVATSIMPYIDRILHEVRKLQTTTEPTARRNERYSYVAELATQINTCNDVLTHWIQLQQGQLSLKIESFPLADLFAVVEKSSMAFSLKGLTLRVEPTDAVVKADKTLTLFMLNTLADNARKATANGGTITIAARTMQDYVEISVSDTGVGFTPDQRAHIFDHKISGGHGFGLLNCKGIIDKYRKTSRLFAVCTIDCESPLVSNNESPINDNNESPISSNESRIDNAPRGSRFFFRLPYGIMRTLVLAVMTLGLVNATHIAQAQATTQAQATAQSTAQSISTPQAAPRSAADSTYIIKAGAMADSAYYCNIKGNYEQALAFADSALVAMSHATQPDTTILLDLHNEAVVASLALHQWGTYTHHNKLYTQLFKEASADRGLADYCQTMVTLSMRKAMAFVLLGILLVGAVVMVVWLLCRRLRHYRRCRKRLQSINNARLAMADDELRRLQYEEEKLHVSNNVIDNCLSALKHETMYYPSRIMQLAADRNLQAIAEVADYYKELYAALCAHVSQQAASTPCTCRPLPLNDLFGINDTVLADPTLLRYLSETLSKRCGARKDIAVERKDNRYLVVSVVCDRLAQSISINTDTDTDTAIADTPNALGTPNTPDAPDLFTPSVENIPLLICKQIVRELSDQTNRHACGITATGNTLHITLPRAAQPPKDR